MPISYIEGVESLERVFVALGSNLSPRGNRLSEGREMLRRISAGGWKESPIYETPPVGPEGQEPYFNQVVSFWYSGTPTRLLYYLKGSELVLGRKPRGHWNSREIDLDLLYYGNKELMQHVWINILGNAVKHTSAGGEISVSLKETRNEIIARIEDTGEGMNSETIEHLFDPYYQGDPSRNDPGLGLGLSIAHRIVELCKGRIEVRSTENVGSEFTVILPKTKMER